MAEQVPKEGRRGIYGLGKRQHRIPMPSAAGWPYRRWQQTAMNGTRKENR